MFHQQKSRLNTKLSTCINDIGLYRYIIDISIEVHEPMGFIHIYNIYHKRYSFLTGYASRSLLQGRRYRSWRLRRKRRRTTRQVAAVFTGTEWTAIKIAGLEHFLFSHIFPYIGNLIIPIDFIFFRGVAQPPTRLVFTLEIWEVYEKELGSRSLEMHHTPDLTWLGWNMTGYSPFAITYCIKTWGWKRVSHHQPLVTHPANLDSGGSLMVAGTCGYHLWGVSH